MTLMKDAKSGKINEIIEEVAREENIEPRVLMQRIAEGKVAIPRNINRKEIKLAGVGKGLRTKVNVNIGTSTLYTDLEMEKRKARVAIKFGADTIMDLSTGKELDKTRRELLKIAPIPFGTVPILSLIHI